MATNDNETRSSRQENKRRSFLRTVMWSSAGLVVAQSALAGLALFWPRKIRGFGGRIRAGKVSDFPVNSVTRFRDGQFYISRLPEGIMALWWKCPHLGCTVPWEPSQNQFVCPCHASTYDRTGQNIAGPAPRPMDYMEVEIVGDQVVVNTGVIHERDRHRPDHVTPV